MTALALSHYSIKPVTTVADPDPARPRGAYKPAGFWVSVDGDDDWPEWCASNDFLPKEPLLRHRVTLATNARVLHLSSHDEVVDLGRRYRSRDPILFPSYVIIDWAKLAADYDGLIIAPYQWGCRMENAAHWYYGWDCASGVIWKACAIASIECLGIADLKVAA